MSFETNTPFLIAPDGTETEVMPANKRDFTGQELYDMLDCELVQVIPVTKDMSEPSKMTWQMWMDEEGKFNDKEFNELASAIAINLMPGDYIVGNALLCPSKYVK